MADPQEHPTQPTQMANVQPMGHQSNQMRQIIDGVASGLNDNRLNDTWKMLTVFGIGFVLLAGLFISGYLLLAGKDERMSDKVQALDKPLRVSNKNLMI